MTDVSTTWALQSQVKSRRQMILFMTLVVVWIDQSCRDVIGCQNVKVAVIGQLLFCCYFLSIFCLLRYVSFIWGHVWVVCKEQVAVDIGSEVLVLSLCTSFLMSVVVVSLCCKWLIQQSPSGRFCVQSVLSFYHCLYQWDSLCLFVFINVQFNLEMSLNSNQWC